MHTNLMFVSCSRLQIVPKIWLLLCPRSTRSKFICNLLNTHGNKPRTKHHLLNFGSAADVSCLFDALSLTCYHSLYSLFVFLGQTDKGSFWCDERSVTITIIPSFVYDHIMKRFVNMFISLRFLTVSSDLLVHLSLLFLCQTCRWSNWYNIISASEFISRLPAVFSRHGLAKHPPTLPTTAAWYYTQIDANSAFRTLDIRCIFLSFFSCWSSSVERSTICAPGSGPDVWPFHTRT